MDPMILGPLLIILMGGGVSAAFYFVAQRYVGRSGRPDLGGATTMDASRRADLHEPR